MRKLTELNELLFGHSTSIISCTIFLFFFLVWSFPFLVELKRKIITSRSFCWHLVTRCSKTGKHILLLSDKHIADSIVLAVQLCPMQHHVSCVWHCCNIFLSYRLLCTVYLFLVGWECCRCSHVKCKSKLLHRILPMRKNTIYASKNFVYDSPLVLPISNMLYSNGNLST